MNLKKKQHNDEPNQLQITINTTFSGKHAKLILDYQNKFQCNKPTALRLILNQLAAGLILTLDPNQEEKIRRLIIHPILQERYRFMNVNNFVIWAINKAISLLSQELGGLSDPSVQQMLDTQESEVARQLLLMSRDPDYYGGVTVDSLNQELKMDNDLIRRILNDFVRNGWVTRLEDPNFNDRYLPKDSTTQLSQ